MHFQRIDVEEVLAVERHSTQHGVIQRALHHVGILAVGFHLQHPAGKHHQANGSTAFGIDRVVWQVIVAAEGLPAALRTDAAGDIQLTPGHIFPQAQAIPALALVLT